ncbi:MAG TPA: HdeD family acid-resistance protein [Nakamurella sp.]
MTTIRGMGTVAAKYWWVLLVRGILLIALGIAMLAWPKETLTVFVVLFAAYLFVDGVMNIFQGFSERRDGQSSGWSFASGALAIIFGIIVLVWPDTVGKVIMYIVAIWAILAAIGGIAAGLRLRKTPGSGWGWFLAWGILAGIFGIALLFNPAAGILSILWLVAIWAIMSGIVFAIASFFVRKVGNAIVNAPQA